MIDVYFEHNPKVNGEPIEHLEFEMLTDIHCDLYDKSNPPKTATKLMVETLQRVNGNQIKDKEEKRKLFLDMEIPERDFAFFRLVFESDPGRLVTIPFTCPYPIDCGQTIELPAIVLIPEKPEKEIERILTLSLQQKIELEYGTGPKTEKYEVAELQVRHPTGRDIEAVWSTKIKYGDEMMQRQLRTRQIINAQGAPINTTLVGKMSLSDRRQWTNWENENRFIDIYQAAPCPKCGKRIIYQVSTDPFFW